MPTSTPSRPWAKPKRITTPLDASLHLPANLATSGESSGSEHDAALSALVHEYFLESELAASAARSASIPAADPTADYDDDEEYSSKVQDAAPSEVAEEIRALLYPANKSDAHCRRLFADVTEVMQALASLRQNRPAFRRAVMARLRDRGHNAGLCKVRWEKSARIVAGSYEYIDAVVAKAAEDGEEARYIVDVGFAAEFELARPTEEYTVVVRALPEVLVAQPKEVRRAVQVMAAAGCLSLKSRGLSVPPWRRRQFMVAKWLGPYRRTVNSVPASAGVVSAAGGGGDAMACQKVVGFVPPPAMAAQLWS